MTFPNLIPPAACPVCNDPVIQELPTDWENRVAAGDTFEVVGCGNPWHYRGLDPDPLTAEIDTTIDYDPGHDGGLLLPMIACAISGAIVGAIAALAIAWLLWSRP